jgi:hypothetical protein
MSNSFDALSTSINSSYPISQIYLERAMNGRIATAVVVMLLQTLCLLTFDKHVHASSLKVNSQHWQKIRIVVEKLGNNCLEAGLTESAIRGIMEAELEAAGLMTQLQGSGSHGNRCCLYANLTAVGDAFHLSLEFHRDTYYTCSSASVGPIFAIAWKRGVLGVHLTPDRILNCLDQLMIEFIKEYLE